MSLYQQIIAALRAQDTNLSDEKLHEFSLEVARRIENQSDLALLPEGLFTQEIIRLSPTIQIMVAENESSIQDAAQYAFRIAVNQVTDDHRSTIPEKYCSEEYCPYPGLTAFSEANANYFCGREGEIEAFLKQIDQRPLTTLTGPSGVGKSSFILAGVLPHLETRFGETAVYLTFHIHTNTDLLQDLASLLSAEVSETTETIVEALKQHDSALFETLQISLSRGKQRIFLILDQFEAIFVGEDGNRKYERNRFLDNLLYAEANGPDPFLTTIITTRENFFEHPAYTSRTRLVDIIQHENVPLRPLNNSQLRHAIEQPLAIFNQQHQSNLQYQDGLVQLIVNAFRNPAVSLPLVQYLLRLLWIEKRHLTHFAYNSLGGLERVLDRHALEIYKGFADGEQNLVKAILIALVRPGISGEYTRKRIRREMLLANRELMQQQKIMAILNRLSDGRSRIISEQQVDNTIYLELTHEIILRQWAFLQELIEARKERIEERERLLPTAELWLASKATRGEIGDPSYLYQGRSSLQRVKRFIDSAQNPEDIDSIIAACYKASQQYRKRTLFRNLFVTIGILIIFSFIVNSLRGQIAFEGQRADENATAQVVAQIAQATAQANATLSAVEQATAVSLAATSDAQASLEISQRATAEAIQSETERQNRVILAQELAAESRIVTQEYPQLSVLLAIEAIYTAHSRGESPVGEAEQALRDALAQIGGIGLGPHEDNVSAVTFSPDGQWLATAIDDNTPSNETSHKHTVQLWNIGETLDEPITLRDNNLTAYVDSITFSPNGRWLATTDNGLCMDWANTVLWELGDSSTINFVNYVLDGCNAIFSHDNRWLATATDTKVFLWNLSEINTTGNPIVLADHTDEIVALEFSPNDQWLAVGEQGDNVTLWEISDLPQVAPYFTLPGHGTRVTNVEFSPDNKWLVTGSGATTGEPASVMLWDMTRSVENPIILPGPTDMFLWDITISPDSHWLAIPNNNSVQVWDISSRESVNAAPITLSGVTTHVFTDSGLPVRSGLARMIFSHNSKWLAATSQDNMGILWDLSSPSYYDQPVFLKGHEQYVVDVTFSSDDRWLATASWDNTARLWDLARLQTSQGTISGAGYLALNNQGDSIRELAVSPNGHWLVATGGTGGGDGNVTKVWNMQEKDSPPVDINIQHKSVRSLAYSPDGMWLATGTREGYIDLWDTSLPNWDDPVFTLTNENQVLDIQFSPDGRWLATGGHDGRVDFWDIDTRIMKNILNINAEKVTSLAFSPDGKWIAIGSDDDMGATSSKASIRILDLETQQTIYTLTDLGTYIGNMAFSPDGQWFAAYTGFYHDWYGSVSLWKSSEIGESPQVFTGKSLAFSPDGQWLALEGGGTIYEYEPTRLWDLSSDDNIVSEFINLTGTSSFGHVLFSPDGDWLITGHFEEIRLWSLQTDKLVDLACHTVGRNLTLSEWEKYFPQEDYRKTCFN